MQDPFRELKSPWMRFERCFGGRKHARRFGGKECCARKHVGWRVGSVSGTRDRGYRSAVRGYRSVARLCCAVQQLFPGAPRGEKKPGNSANLSWNLVWCLEPVKGGSILLVDLKNGILPLEFTLLKTWKPPTVTLSTEMKSNLLVGLCKGFQSSFSFFNNTFGALMKLGFRNDVGSGVFVLLNRLNMNQPFYNKQTYFEKVKLFSLMHIDLKRWLLLTLSSLVIT